MHFEPTIISSYSSVVWVSNHSFQSPTLLSAEWNVLHFRIIGNSPSLTTSLAATPSFPKRGNYTVATAQCVCHIFQVSYGRPINNLACQMCNLGPLIATHSSDPSRQTFSTQNDRESLYGPATAAISPPIATPSTPAGNWFIRPEGFSARFVLCCFVLPANERKL